MSKKHEKKCPCCNNDLEKIIYAENLKTGYYFVMLKNSCCCRYFVNFLRKDGKYDVNSWILGPDGWKKEPPGTLDPEHEALVMTLKSNFWYFPTFKEMAKNVLNPSYLPSSPCVEGETFYQNILFPN